MKTVDYTDRDVELAREILSARESDPDDDGGPETAMFSWGYGDVWLDGEVSAYGVVVFNVNDI